MAGSWDSFMEDVNTANEGTGSSKFNSNQGGNWFSSYAPFLFGGASALTGLFGSSQEAPKLDFSVNDINGLIDKYRQSGMAGISQLGRDERQNATQRLAASGLEPSLALKQSLYNPILNQLSGSRANLEGQLAGTEGNLLMQRAMANQQAEMAQYQNQQNTYSGLSDILGTAALFFGL